MLYGIIVVMMSALIAALFYISFMQVESHAEAEEFISANKARKLAEKQSQAWKTEIKNTIEYEEAIEQIRNQIETAVNKGELSTTVDFKCIPEIRQHLSWAVGRYFNNLGYEILYSSNNNGIRLIIGWS